MKAEIEVCVKYPSKYRLEPRVYDVIIDDLPFNVSTFQIKEMAKAQISKFIVKSKDLPMEFKIMNVTIIKIIK